MSRSLILHARKLLVQSPELQGAFRHAPEQLDAMRAGILSGRPLLGLLEGYRSRFVSSSAILSKEEAGNGSAAADKPEGGAAEGQEEESPLTLDECKAALDETATALEEARKKAEEFKDKLVRTLADMENLRERTARQMAEAKQFASQGVVKSLLEVADNLERAAGSVAETDVNGTAEVDLDRALGLLKSLRDGVVMTDSILMKVLEKEGVTRYDPMGQSFDPNLHAALFQVPDATKDPGTVAVVIKKGYMMHDRPLRAAEVGVAFSPDSE